MAEQLPFLLRDTRTGQEYPISPGGLRVGRTPENDVVLGDEQVSRHHATLWAQAGQLYVRDENSTNGTWVNEQRISAPTALQAGDQVRVGTAVFQVTAAQVAPVPPSPPGPAVQPAGPRPEWPLVAGAAVVLVALIGGLLLASRRGGARPSPLTPVIISAVTPAPSITPTPSLTHTATPTRRPARTLSPTPTATFTPTPTSVPTPLPAPSRLEPVDGTYFVGASADVTFRWSEANRPLEADEYYVLIIEHRAGKDFTWTKEPWHFADDKRWLPDYGPELRWQVVIARQRTGEPNEDPTGAELSGYSTTGAFSWRPEKPDEGGGGERG